MERVVQRPTGTPFSAAPLYFPSLASAANLPLTSSFATLATSFFPTHPPLFIPHPHLLSCHYGAWATVMRRGRVGGARNGVSRASGPISERPLRTVDSMLARVQRRRRGARAVHRIGFRFWEFGIV